MILKIFVKSKNEQMTLYLLASIKMFKCLLAILTSKTDLFLITYTYPTFFLCKIYSCIGYEYFKPIESKITYLHALGIPSL